MNYTTNYHLPQWVETDRIQMEDFNQAMADIDEGLTAGNTSDEQIRAILASGLTPEGKVMESGRFTIQPSTAANTVMVTFDFAPQVVLVEIEAALVILEKNSTRMFSVDGGRYHVIVELRGNQLILRGNSDLTSNATVLYITWP